MVEQSPLFGFRPNHHIFHRVAEIVPKLTEDRPDRKHGQVATPTHKDSRVSLQSDLQPISCPVWPFSSSVVEFCYFREKRLSQAGAIQELQSALTYLRCLGANERANFGELLWWKNIPARIGPPPSKRRLFCRTEIVWMH